MSPSWASESGSDNFDELDDADDDSANEDIAQERDRPEIDGEMEEGLW